MIFSLRLKEQIILQSIFYFFINLREFEEKVVKYLLDNNLQKGD